MDNVIEPIIEPAAPSLLDFNLFGWPLTGLVTLFALGVYFVLAFNVGLARKRHSVPAPAVGGHPEFERILRAQLNTLEHLVMFLPLLWMAAFASNDMLAALIGVFWPISRILYAMGYYADAGKRRPGFLMGIAVNAILFLLVAVQMVRSLVFWADGGAGMPPV